MRAGINKDVFFCSLASNKFWYCEEKMHMEGAMQRGANAGLNMRSCFGDFDLKNAAELEAHINMNAIAAKANFDKYYSERLSDLTLIWKEQRRRLDVREPLEIPAVIIDVSSSKFDYNSISGIYRDKIVEREAQKKAREAAAQAGDETQYLGVRKDNGDPVKLVLKGVDYTNVDKIVPGLIANTEVTRLQLSDNGLEPDDCDAISRLIRENKTLVALDLSGNKIGGEGLAKLADSLSGNPRIEDLDLGANTLSRSAGKSLAAILSSPTCNIQRLQLAGNQLGIYGTEELCIGLKNCKCVKSLGLQNNNIGNDGAQKLLDILLPGSTSVGETVAEKNCSLVQANLEANRIDDALVLTVAKSLWLNEQVQLRVHLTKLEEDNRAIIAAEIESEAQLLELLFIKSTEEKKAELAAKAAAAAAAAAAPPPKASPPGKAGGKSLGTKSPVKAAPKSGATPSSKASVPAPAPSTKVKASAPERNVSPKKPAPKK